VRRLAGSTIRLAVAAGACVLGAVGCSHQSRSESPRPEETPITITVGPGSAYADTGVVRAGKTVWLGTAVATQQGANTVRVYRWSGKTWSLDGVVRVPDIPALTGGGYLSTASLTSSGAPDFALSTFGADTRWLAVIARSGGKWRSVRFDYRRGPTVGIDAWGIRGTLVRAEADSCSRGCAGGPETYSWYRFDGGMFVPTAPPGPAAECSAAALDDARPLVNGQPTDTEVLRNVDAPFAVTRFACANGWALAARRGKHALALFEQRGHTWLRDAVGSRRAIRAHADEFALAHSLLWRLAAQIGAPLGPRPRPDRRDFAVASPRTEPRWERASVRVAVTPRSSYADSRVIYRSGRKWLAVAFERTPEASGRRHPVDVHVFRWARAAWKREETVHVDVATVHPERPLQFVESASLTGVSTPDITVGPSVPFPSWLSVISAAGGRWHTIPFRTRHGDRVAIDAVRVGGKVVESYENETTKIVYRFRHRSFEIYRRVPAPGCDPQLLARLAEPPLHVTGAACAYGWALAAGTRNGQRVVAIYEELRSKWTWLETTAPSRIASFESADGIPMWVSKQLAGRIRSR
jgi:hypothetical protein